MNKKIPTPLAILIILLVIAVIIGISLWLCPKEETENVACTQETKICPDGSYVSRTGPNCEFAGCPIIEQNETADWQTYRNDKYGFEVKYPKEWIIIKEGEESKVKLEKFVVFADEKEAERQGEKQAGEIRCAAGVYFYDNDKFLSLYDWAIDQWGKPENREAGKIIEMKINNLEGIKYEFMSMGTQTNVLFSKDNKVIDIQTTFDGCTDLNMIFTQMLSTFKFLE